MQLLWFLDCWDGKMRDEGNDEVDRAYVFPVGVFKFFRSRTAAAAAPAAASKCVGSESKVSEKDLGEMKEKEKRGAVLCPSMGVRHLLSAVPLMDVVSDVLQLHADEYAVCGFPDDKDG